MQQTIKYDNMITRTDLSKAHLMSFYQTMANVRTHLQAENLADLELQKVVNEVFFPAFATMDEALKQTRISGLTETILKMDARRDLMVICLGEHLSTFTHYPDADTATAAQRLLFTLRKYGKSIQELPNPAETGVISNLLQDYDTPEAVSDLAKTKADAWVQEMRAANEEFQNLSDERTRKEAQYEVGKARTARIALQEAFKTLAKNIDALAILKGPQKYETLAANINSEVDAALQVVKQRITTAKNQSKTNSDNSTV